MAIEPLYAKNIIVGIKKDNKFNWYITDAELWYLDENKLESAYKILNIEIYGETVLEERKGIRILNEENASEFLSRIEKNKSDTIEIRNMLLDKKKSSVIDDLLDFQPALFVDFDDKILYSMYPEPASYEYYVPEGWLGKYESFEVFIPNEARYWINLDGTNIFNGV